MYDFNPLRGLRGRARRRATAEISRYVRQQVIAYMDGGNSPVSGQTRYRKLSKDYANEKKGGNRLANLELTSALKDSIFVDTGPKGALRISVSASQQPKADGHNDFNRISSLPRRAFIPDTLRNERFKRSIESGINSIANRFKRENL
jgi:hypothetical protein